MKRLLALLLALGMTVGLMAGCGSDKSSAESKAETTASQPASEAETEDAEEEVETTAEPAEPASADEEAEASALSDYAVEVFGSDAAPEEVSYPIETEETLELVATFPDSLFSSYNGIGDCLIYQQAEEETGIHVEFNSLSTSASAEKFNVMMSSGDYPDLVGWGLNYATGDDAAVEQDIYLDLTEYIAQYAPNYYNLLTADDELLKSAVSESGYITAFFGLTTEDSLGKAGMVIRTDLLEKLGLSKPYTIEEWEQTLAAFKSEGLEQPLMMLSVGAIQDNWLSGAFDVAAFCNNFPQSTSPIYVVDGEVKFGPVEEGFREYITLMHEWYEKGYIYSDFISKNDNWNGPDYTNAITTGEAGIFYTDMGNIGGLIENSEIEGFDLEATYDMHATEDSVNHFAQFTKKSASNGFRITTNCENVELACRWGDWWYTEAGSLLANYGVEGTSFEYDENNEPKFTETVTEAPEGMRDALLIYASNGTINCVIDSNAAASSYSEVDQAAPEIWATGMDDSYVIPSAVSLTADESTEASNIYSDIETTCMEYIAAFITGAKSLDEFDTFVATIQDLGIEDYLSIYQTAFDRYMAR